MSAFWRGLPAVNKIKTYLMGMVSSGYGLDTAMPPAATLYLLACWTDRQERAGVNVACCSLVAQGASRDRAWVPIHQPPKYSLTCSCSFNFVPHSRRSRIAHPCSLDIPRDLTLQITASSSESEPFEITDGVTERGSNASERERGGDRGTETGRGNERERERDRGGAGRGKGDVVASEGSECLDDCDEIGRTIPWIHGHE